MIGKPVRGGARRYFVAGGQKGLDPGGGPAGRFRGKCVEPALDHRQGPGISANDESGFVERRFALGRIWDVSGDVSNQSQKLAKLSHLAARVGGGGDNLGRGLVGHERKSSPDMAKEALMRMLAWARSVGQSAAKRTI